MRDFLLLIFYKSETFGTLQKQSHFPFLCEEPKDQSLPSIFWFKAERYAFKCVLKLILLKAG